MANFVPPLLLDAEAVRPAGRFTRGVDGALALHDGSTPGGERFNRFMPRGAAPSERRVSEKLDEQARTPEDYGAVGDGIHDDAPAIQRALDAIKAASVPGVDTRPGTLMLTPGKRYRCESQLVMDRAFHNLQGCATLDFSSWVGTYIRVTGSLTEFGSGYGQNGSMAGQIVIRGAGPNTASVGVLFDSPVSGVATHIHSSGITVTGCGVAWQIGSHGYNQVFYNCKAFACGVIFDWLGVANDNDEQINIVNGTFYNSGLFLRHKRPAGRVAMFGGSVDYVQRLFDVESGKYESFGTHYESNVWQDAAITVAGDCGNVTLNGGWFLIQLNNGGVVNYANVGASCVVKFVDVKTNNTNNILTPNGYTPTTWARGAGRFEMRGTEPAFELGGFPARLHATRTQLIDPDFDTGSLAKSQCWRTADTNGIEDRYGLTAPAGAGAPNNLTFAFDNTGQLNGVACLRLNKAYGPGSSAAAVVSCIPVRPGDKVACGFRAARAADRPGTGPIFASLKFVAIDGHDTFGIPIIAHEQSLGGDVTYNLESGWTLVAPWSGLSQVIAPTWATHCLLTVNLAAANQASILIDGRWADTF